MPAGHAFAAEDPGRPPVPSAARSDGTGEIGLDGARGDGPTAHSGVRWWHRAIEIAD